jgi:hypothetical protein
MKELEKEQAKINRNNKNKINSDNDLYSDEGTEINGKEKLIQLHKIKQYKTLFPDELKTFKIKPNCSVSELKQYIDEMDIIVSTSNVDEFITDSILQCIKLIEIPTSRTKNFNITGLSDLLKANKQFHQLCKKLYLKYGCFEKIPEEAQLLMLVSTTAYVCKNKNAGRNELEKYLNEPIELPLIKHIKNLSKYIYITWEILNNQIKTPKTFFIKLVVFWKKEPVHSLAQ